MTVLPSRLPRSGPHMNSAFFMSCELMGQFAMILLLMYRMKSCVLGRPILRCMSLASLAYDYTKAKLARDIQRRIARPSTQYFIRYVNNKIIANCPISSQDIKNAEFIWGPDLGSLKGKKVRSTPSYVRTQIYNIPSQIMQ